MELIVLGCSGSYPAPGRPASGYLIRAEGKAVVCDMGPGTFQRLVEISEPAELEAVVISHAHLDHCSDIFALYHYLKYGPNRRESPMPVHAPQDLEDRFMAFLSLGDGDYQQDVLRFVGQPGDGPIAAGPFTLEFVGAAHSIPGIFTKVSCDGRSLVYTGDTGPSATLESFAAGASLLLCEATQPEADRWEYHLTPAEAGAAAAAAGVERLVLTHLRPTFSPELARDEAAVEFGRDPLVAEPGLVLEI